MKDFTTNASIFDVNGKEVYCNGDWHAKVTLNQFLAAVTGIHEVRGQKGPFQQVCINCVQKWEADEKSNGCRFHAGKIRLWRQGNPRDCDILKQAYKEGANTVKGHIIKGAYQILPDELREIRKLLMSTNKVEDLQLYCMIVVSIFLFLRHDEFSGIHCSHIQRDLCIFKDGVMQCLAIKVCEKTDKIWRTLLLRRKDDSPEFCPI